MTNIKIGIEELKKALYTANETYISAVYTVDEAQATLDAATDAYYIAFYAFQSAIAYNETVDTKDALLKQLTYHGDDQ